MNINYNPAETYIVMPGRRTTHTSTNAKDPESQTSRPPSQRLPGLGWLPRKARNHMIAMMGEFVGTFMFLFFAFSATQIANAHASSSSSATGVPNTSDLLFVALGFGFSLVVNVWVFFRISGGLFNPAVTLGMCLIGAVEWIRGGLIFLSQLLGALASAGVVSALFPGPLNVGTRLRDTSIVRGLFIEMFLTAMLVFTVFMLAAEKHKGTFLAPIGIGLAMFIAELSGVYFTGGSLNPARSFGPDVVNHSWTGYHWIYWLGPALGSLLAVVMYRLIKTLEYETANPGQDFDENEIEAFDPGDDPTPEDVRRPQVYGISSSHVANDETDGKQRSVSAPRRSSLPRSLRRTVSASKELQPPRQQQHKYHRKQDSLQDDDNNMYLHPYQPRLGSRDEFSHDTVDAINAATGESERIGRGRALPEDQQHDHSSNERERHQGEEDEGWQKKDESTAKERSGD